MATPAQRTNTWILDEWYDQSVAGTTGGYNAFSTGSLWAWGHNENGMLAQNQDSGGPGNQYSRSSPAQIGTNTNWSDIAAGGMEWEGGIAMKNDGTMWVWGRNSYGTLGLNQAPAQLAALSSPAQIPGTWGVRTDEDVYIDRNNKASIKGNVMGIKADGTLWCWGGNGFGALGTNQPHNTAYSSPVQVGTDTTWTSTMMGRDMGVFALKSDNTLWAWGRNPGRLGLNDTVHRSSPVQLPGTTWRSTRQGTGQHPLATKTDGSLWGWGGNNQGQLGQNSTTNAGNSSPIQISGTTWRTVTTMDDSSAATKTDGSLWTWGRNEAGVLGQNQQGNAISSPTQVGTDTTWMNITSTSNQSLMATKTDGTLWAWGQNQQGQMGKNNGTNARRSSPVQVPGTWVTTRLGAMSLASIAMKV